MSTPYKLYFRSDINNKNKRICQVHDIIKYKEVLGNYICEKLLFVHSFTGCDTTSSFYGIGKGTALKYFIKSDDFQNIVSVFMNPNATQSQVKNAGERAVLILYHSKEPTIDLTREKMLS